MPRHSTRPRSAPERQIPDADALPRDQRARRDAIVAAAVARIATTDYADISVKQVAEEAGVALGTLYRYFSSKDHLMACALLAWASRFDEGIERESAVPRSARLAAIYRRAARAFEREPRVHDTLLQLQASRDPHAMAAFTRFAERQLASFESALGDAPETTRADVTMIMSAVLSESLRSCQSGSCSRAEVYRRIDRAAELVTAGVDG
ncbi:MAG: helix-turn-helix domain-containing protein [Acidimicrobiales bacterium]